MITKTCTKCDKLKPLDDFYKKPKGHNNICKQCTIRISKEYYKNNKEKRAEYINKNNETIRSKYKEYCIKNKEKRTEYHKIRYKEHKDKYTKYTLDNKEHIRGYNKIHYQNNKDKYRKYNNNRYTNNLIYNIRMKCRSRIYNSLHSQSVIKNNKTIELLGCDYNFYKEYLTNLFTEGMSWNKILNAEIEIDHIKPLIEFDLTDPEEQLIAFNYKNTQPLWMYDNRRKGSFYVK